MNDWAQVQSDLRDGTYGDWNAIRRALCDRQAAQYPDHGITSSDISHLAYGWVQGGADLGELGLPA